MYYRSRNSHISRSANVYPWFYIRMQSILTLDLHKMDDLDSAASQMMSVSRDVLNQIAFFGIDIPPEMFDENLTRDTSFHGQDLMYP